MVSLFCFLCFLRLVYLKYLILTMFRDDDLLDKLFDNVTDSIFDGDDDDYIWRYVRRLITRQFSDSSGRGGAIS